MSIGDRIKEARKKAGLTQVELSERIGVRHSAIHKYETGIVENIPVSKLQKIASALDIPMSYLLGIADTPEDRTKTHWMELSGPEDKEFVNVLDEPVSEVETEKNFNRIRTAYGKLNETGQKAAAERVEELAELPKYKRKKYGI